MFPVLRTTHIDRINLTLGVLKTECVPYEIGNGFVSCNLAISCDLRAGKSDDWAGFSPSTWVFPCEYHSTHSLYSSSS